MVNLPYDARRRCFRHSVYVYFSVYRGALLLYNLMDHGPAAAAVDQRDVLVEV